jgi:hypothetical protein
MDAPVILGLVMWTAVVVILVNILFETAKWEDARRSKTDKSAFGFDAGAPVDRDACYERCMKEFLWNPEKEPACLASCSL